MIADTWVGTFYSVGAKMLRKRIHVLPQCGRKPGFSIIDPEDTPKIVKKIVGADASKELKMKVLTQLVFDAKEKSGRERLMRGWDEVPSYLFWHKRKEQILEGYERELSENNLMDFEDLIILPLRILDENAQALKQYRDRFRHLLVEEFQDTDHHHHGIVRQLASGESTHLFVVGDINQSIYEWRGARPEYMHTLLDKDFQGIVTLKLSQNYRSSSNILEAAADLISASEGDRGFGTDGALTFSAVKPLCKMIKASWSFSDGEEAARVVEEIGRLVKNGKAMVKEGAEGGGKWSDFAILYRAHSQSRAFEKALVKNKRPFEVLTKIPFYSRKLRLTYFRMGWMKGIGEKSVCALKEWAHNIQLTLPVALMHFGSDLLRKEEGLKIGPKVRIGYLKDLEESKSAEESEERAERWEKVGDFKTLAHHRGRQVGGGREGLIVFLEDIALVAGREREKEEGEFVGASESNCVKLMTIHASKGSEFDTVFLPGLEEGLLPSGKEEERSVEDTDEERRLCYVGMTRAKERL